MNFKPQGTPRHFSSGLYFGLSIWKMVSKVIMNPFLACLFSGVVQKIDLLVRTSVTGEVWSDLRQHVLVRIGLEANRSLSSSNNLGRSTQLIIYLLYNCNQLLSNHTGSSIDYEEVDEGRSGNQAIMEESTEGVQFFIVRMDEIKQNCRQELPKANPIQKRVPVTPKSIMPLIPLPNFNYSQEQVDLAPPFKTKQQQQQLNLEPPELRQLFSKPIYQSHNKFNLQAVNNKFACLKASYSESTSHPVETVQIESNGLVFESRFDSGNLAFAAKSENQNEYYLVVHKDINSTRCTQWFFFRTHNNNFKGRVTFHILNFFKSYSSYQNGMKIIFCSLSNNYTWSRGCQDIKYRKTNLKVSGEKYHYALSFSYEFCQQNDTTYFAHSAPYTFSMLDNMLLKISNSMQNRMICKRKTIAQSPGGNYVDMLIISNFKKQKTKRTVFITSRVHPGQTPSSFVCQGLIKYLLSEQEDAKQLRQDFVFKIVPMLNPDGVINGSYRCSLSGYDLNRVWHCDNKTNSPQIYYTKKAIIDSQNCFLFIDLHAHSKKKGVFMYGCQNNNTPFLSRHIPYLFWKEIPHFNYYQSNFGMKVGRQGTSRLSVYRTINLLYSYTMQHSFCGPVKEKYHFTIQHYRNFGKGICQTLKKYYTSSKEDPSIFKELYQNKQLLQVGKGQNSDSSDDSDLDQSQLFSKKIEGARPFRRKPTNQNNFRSKLMEFSGDKSKPKDLRRTFHSNQGGFRLFERRNNSQNRNRLMEFIPGLCSVNIKKEQEFIGQEVVLTTRPSQSDRFVPEKQQEHPMTARHSQRYQYTQMECLNNLFLPSITSASYKRYGKKKNYPKHLVQVGRQYLESQGIVKQQIRSTSHRKPVCLKEQVLSYL